MATGKKKRIDEMKMMELFKVMEVLGVSDEGVETLSDARSRVRSALNTDEKTSNWSAGKVRYFSVSEGFSTSTSLAGVHVFFFLCFIYLFSFYRYSTNNIQIETYKHYKIYNNYLNYKKKKKIE